MKIIGKSPIIKHLRFSNAYANIVNRKVIICLKMKQILQQQLPL